MPPSRPKADRDIVITTPPPLVAFWREEGKCIQCLRECRDLLHLHNHYRRYHASTAHVVQTRYFFWYTFDRKWVECSLLTYEHARMLRIPVAHTKQRKEHEHGTI